MTDLRPLVAGEYRDNPDGSRSTEITVTVPDGQGGWMLIPSLWKGKEIQEFNEDQARDAAMQFEQRTGNKFPRFASPEEAGAFAKQRSSAGGVSGGPLYVPSVRQSIMDAMQ